jgi:hypothetical protein
MGKSLVFDLNANPERAAFQIAKPGMMDPKATTLLPPHIQSDFVESQPRDQAVSGG